MSESDVKMPDAHVTEEMIEDMRKRAGLKLRIDHHVNNEEATRIAILKFAEGVGDTNPLWTDPEYAQKTRYGTVVAPPSWVLGVYSGIQFGWPGLGGFHNSTRMEFFKPVLRNDIITPECTFTGFEGPKSSDFAEIMFINWYENKYFNQKNELVATSRWSAFHIERAKARKRKKFDHITLPHPWKDEELKKMQAELANEKRNGKNTPDWDDVVVGDKTNTIIKGPLGLTDEIAFLVGGGAPIPRLASCGAALEKYIKHPAWSFRDPATHALEPIFAVHYNKEASKAMGLQMPYDVGFQRQCWQIHLITNWMGDDAWLKSCFGEYRKFNYFSDVVHFSGKIVEKFKDDDGEYCVKIETNAINQRGENIMPGYAIVSLPSKVNHVSPLDRRL